MMAGYAYRSRRSIVAWCAGVVVLLAGLIWGLHAGADFTYWGLWHNGSSSPLTAATQADNNAATHGEPGTDLAKANMVLVGTYKFTSTDNQPHTIDVWSPCGTNLTDCANNLPKQVSAQKPGFFVCNNTVVLVVEDVSNHFVWVQWDAANSTDTKSHMPISAYNSTVMTDANMQTAYTDLNGDSRATIVLKDGGGKGKTVGIYPAGEGSVDDAISVAKADPACGKS